MQKLDYDKAGSYVSRSLIATFVATITATYLMQTKFTKVDWSYNETPKEWWLALAKTVAISVIMSVLLMWATQEDIPQKLTAKIKE